MAIELGDLREVRDLRTVWPREARDFTPWLADNGNISRLSEALGMEIEIEDTEAEVGDFSLDILATERESEKRVIIENQLEDTDHDHLGKLITYAAGKNAAVVVWIVKRAREEHKAAIEWLNNHTDDSVGFFLCEIKLYTINGSVPAPRFEVVEKPNDWAKEIKGAGKLCKRQQANKEYWSAYGESAAGQKGFSRMFKVAAATTSCWLNHGVGESVYHMTASRIVRRKELSVEVYIPNNKELYYELLKYKDKIEEKAGCKLEWREPLDCKRSGIRLVKIVDYIEDCDTWNEQFAWIRDSMTRLYLAVKPFVH